MNHIKQSVSPKKQYKAQSNYIKCLKMDGLFGTWIMYCEIQAPWQIYDNDDTRHCIMSINLKNRRDKETENKT